MHSMEAYLNHGEVTHNTKQQMLETETETESLIATDIHPDPHPSLSDLSLTQEAAFSKNTYFEDRDVNEELSPPFTPLSSYPSLPPPVGLYHPSNERDACGVGMVAHVRGIASHQLVRDGLHMLKRMSHRGACGCDAQTGDGAGILTAIPHAYFSRVLRQQWGKTLPSAGQYAVGNVFLSQDWDERQRAKAHIEKILALHQISIIAWRPVPVDNQQLGEGSRNSEPCIEQMFVSCPPGIDSVKYKTSLLLARKRIRNLWKEPSRLYICSFSSEIIIYKGQLTPEQLESFFIDVGQKDFTSHFILVHSRFSTNTFPSWERAQPLRCIAHNGEINTLKGNSNWMYSRQGTMRSNKLSEEELQEMFPIIDPDTSDSGAFDNVVELMSTVGEFSIEESMLMMIPEPWQKHATMPVERRDMYEYLSHKLEPWDGPALMTFTDGKRMGATLDRNGLRPGRIYILDDDRVILASEVGVLPTIPDSQIKFKSRLTPGEMFLIDFEAQRIVSDAEIKAKLSSARPYGEWLRQHQIDLTAYMNSEEFKAKRRLLKPSALYNGTIKSPTLDILDRLKLFGYTMESLNIIIGPMVLEGMESLGSMGNDQALACLSELPKVVYDYFQQLFAQVTNPPIDPIRESIVMTLSTPIGPEANLLFSGQSDCSRIYLEGPVLNYEQLYALMHLPQSGWAIATLDMTFDKSEGPSGLERGIRRLCEEAATAIKNSHKVIVLSDKAAGPNRVPISSLMAVGAVHHHLVSQSLRSQVGIIVECGDAYEVHHMCLLVGFGCDAIVPYVAYDACRKFQQESRGPNKIHMGTLVANFQQSAHSGILKVMAKMGISTLQSYKGAQIFEAVGLAKEVISLCFTGCSSRIAGSGFELLAKDALQFHERAFPVRKEHDNNLVSTNALGNPGSYHWRTGVYAEKHLNHPSAIAKLQEAARQNSRQAYAEFAALSNGLAEECTLRGQFVLKRSRHPIPLDQVEPAKNIVKRFATGAMSYGSISIESHSALALAMNRIGGKSNTGEGGEHISRYEPSANGQSSRSAIKQVASGRFGVTIFYLSNSDEIQIKMAQGAKPGEGGELPGHKVAGEIAKTRNSTPGVGLISPPPHHDIYSIEDLAQLIFDLKNANPTARISVKLVSEVGVGVVASGVAKGKADHILISGHDGGTGACFAAGTDIRMYDGSIKSVEFISVGDVLMGDTNLPRKVIHTSSGHTDIMYQISADEKDLKPTPDPILVTENHVLVFSVNSDSHLGYDSDRECWTVSAYLVDDENNLRLRTFHYESRREALNKHSDCLKTTLWMPTVEEFIGYPPHIRKLAKFTRALQPVEYHEKTNSGTNTQDYAVVIDPIPGFHQYFGFTLAGENQRFLLKDNTIAHNSKWTGIKHAGLPWELGLAEAHQTLVMNGLRGRVVLQTDGQLKTGLDIMKAALLGAEEFCFATSVLITLGCIMMRKCHLNTCPVGIATQDPELRQKFAGQPEHVINYLFMMAEECRQYMAQLGIRKFDELVGRTDLLERRAVQSEKLKSLDLSSVLVFARTLNPSVAVTCVEKQDHGLDDVFDRRVILQRISDRLTTGKKIQANFRIQNLDRSVGTLLSHEVTKRFGLFGLPTNTIHLRFKGSAGQSFCAWLAPGITMELNGDANDYVGKGLSGGRIIIYPSRESTFKSEDNVIVGNVCLYGATSGTAFFCGRALNRFCVRNSGANTVVEGVGDHGCEYMTGGIVVILGPTGRNFAAGMSGGVAFVYDPFNKLAENCNRGLVQLEHIDDKEDLTVLEQLIDQHRLSTGSAIADRVLWNWEESVKHFVKVIASEYKAVLEAEKSLRNQPADSSASNTSNGKTMHSTSASNAQQQSCETCPSECTHVQPSSNKKTEDEASQMHQFKKGFTENELNEQKKKAAFDIEDNNAAIVKHVRPSALRPVRPIIVSKPKKKRGFIEYERGAIAYRDAAARIHDFAEIYTDPPNLQLRTQAARCMDCGVPFCHQDSNGCPLGNKIPEWNELVYQDRWREALDRLLETNNFPEFTGRACPAPCEAACVLSIIEKSVTIKNIENTIIERAWKEGWMVARPPRSRTGKKVAIIGSGPAGLAVADQLNHVGHTVTVYERADRIGGLLMYGVPNMKLDKRHVVDRRVDLMRKEGVKFKVNCQIGGPEIKAIDLLKDHEVLILCTGSTRPRDLPIPGRDLSGIEFAMDYLTTSTKSLLDSNMQDGRFIDAKGKRVLVIGGGDTGNDCIGTAIRHGATSVINFELLTMPPQDRASNNPWPQWPRIFRIDYGHEEVQAAYGSDPRQYSILSKRFLDDGHGNVSGVETVRIIWDKDADGQWVMNEVEGSTKVIDCDLVLLAMGFMGPETQLVADLSVDIDDRGNYAATIGKFRTSRERVFAAGDCRRGQSLIVNAIAEGRQCAREVDRYLMGTTVLP